VSDIQQTENNHKMQLNNINKKAATRSSLIIQIYSQKDPKMNEGDNACEESDIQSDDDVDFIIEERMLIKKMNF
jgi:hypothetical protein